MPRKQKVIPAGASKAERVRARKPLGKLSSNVISKRTEDRYEQSFKAFLQFHQLERSFTLPPLAVFDDMLAEFIEHLWETGEPKSLANYTVAAVQFFRPEVKHHVPWAWKLVKIWNQLEVPQRATPLSPELLLSFAGQAFKWRQLDFGWLLVVGFTLFLRTGELLGIRAQDVHIHGNRAIVYLAPSKGAKRMLLPLERVETTERVSVQALRALLKGRHPGDCLWQQSRQTFMSYWHELVHALHLDGLNYFPYSLRRGGASSAYRQGASLDSLVTKGRWQHVATARIYLDTALQSLATMTLPAASRPFLLQAELEFRKVSQEGARGRR